MRPSRVWYLAYGSNVNADRFRLYLEGGETEPGARDPSPPRRDRWAIVPAALRFAMESQRWRGGGVAFLTPDPGSRAWVRAWDISAEQFEDVFAQENRGRVGQALPWSDLLNADHLDHLDIGQRWYRRLLRLALPELEALEPGQPCLTFTWATEAAPNPPDEQYRATIEAGLADNPELDAAAIRAYLDTSSLGG